MENKLLILGLLLSHEMHGYQLYEVLKQNPGTPISLKKPNTYKLLGDMEKDGWVTYFTEQEGNRPPRQVYSVTEKGEASFYRLLRENLSSSPSPEFPGVVGLDFLHLLPSDEVTILLETRLGFVESKFQALDEIEVEIRQSHLASEYLHQYYQNEIEWLTGIIARLETDRELI